MANIDGKLGLLLEKIVNRILCIKSFESDDLRTTLWIAKPYGIATDGAFTLSGVFEGVGSGVWTGVIENSSIVSVYACNGTLWQGNTISFSYKVESGIGYLGLSMPNASSKKGGIGTVIWG
jgi:hypothetical protein